MWTWPIVAVDVDEDSEFEDCRAIAEIGYRVNSQLKTQTALTTAIKISSDNSHYHVEVEGVERRVRAASDGDRRYVRALEEDSAEDPLLHLPSIDRWRSEQRYSNL